MKVEIRSKVVILLCIVLAVFSSCITDDDDDRGDFALVAGDALPQFSVEMSDGGVLNTQSFSGKVGVIVFFIRIVRIVRKNFRLFRKFMIRIKRIRMYYCLVSAVRNRALKYKPIGKNIRFPCLFPLRMMMLSFRFLLPIPFPVY